ncbi:hypothetical protein RUND412_002003 [Rhizina undulata]
MALLKEFGRIFTRAFHSTPVPCAKHAKRRLEHMLRNVPPYPQQIKHTFKQSWFGLYGGKHIQFGNNVPESEYKTRRNWLPNVKHKKLYSRALKQFVELRVTTSVMRTIDKVGGLDAYLLGSKAARVKELGPTGWKLRCRVMNSPVVKAELDAERKRLGLDDKPAPSTTQTAIPEKSKGPVQEELARNFADIVEEKIGSEKDAQGNVRL